MRIPVPDSEWKLDFRVLQYWLSLEDDPESEPGMQQAARRMAAVLTQIAGPNRAASAVSQLRWSQIEALTFEMARLDVETLSEYEVDVLAEHDRIVSELPPDIGPTGIDYARKVLEKAIGVQGAIDVINRLTRSLELPPFDDFRSYDPHLILTLLEQQHPQIIALVLCNLETARSALLLSAMDSAQKTGIVQRIAELREVARESARSLDRAFNRELLSAAVDPVDSGGPQRAAEIVEAMDEESQREIIMRAHPDLLFEMLERSPDVLRAVNDRIQSEDQAKTGGGPSQDPQIEERLEGSEQVAPTGDAPPAASGDGAADARSVEVDHSGTGAGSSGALQLDPVHAENFSAALPVFAAHCADDLSAVLGIAFRCKLESLEILDYDGFRRTREEPAVVVVLDASPLPGRWLVELSAAMVFAFVDRLAGGPGLPLRPERECTRIEAALLDRILEPMLERLSLSLADHSIIATAVRDATHPGLLQVGFVALPGDRVYRARFATRLGETPGWMTLIVPINSLVEIDAAPKDPES